MNRRSFIGKMLAAVLAYEVAPFAKAAARKPSAGAWMSHRFYIALPDSKMYCCPPYDSFHQPTIIKGPTPKALIKGELGKTYFNAVLPPRVLKVFLDGIDVTNRSVEIDMVTGWARMYDMEPDGKTVKIYSPHGHWKNSRPDYIEPHTIERIHFGRVEVNLVSA